MRCTREVWNTLKVTLQSASEAEIDAMLTNLQNIKLAKRESVVEYSSLIMGVISELESAGHTVTNIEKRRACFEVCRRSLT